MIVRLCVHIVFNIMWTGSVIFKMWSPFIVLDLLHLPDVDLFFTLLFLLCFPKRLTFVDCINSTPGLSGFWLGVANNITSKRSEGGKRDRNYFHPARSWPDNGCIPQPSIIAPVDVLFQIPVTFPFSCLLGLQFISPVGFPQHCLNTRIYSLH